ncbi:DUF4358 domain-containing protein [Candidatus Arthromitus sp. SFB-turkey]|uniref:DUF4358 domain-containing protein n=1 Tax=Candidatus Arthromitus sp. SFB-turkey TaxID=1840217 RepID=UPI0007F50613|nr:DUF4358 domain-containing protein [Candidatus Arthromitus sp. SFB-turkey]OAT88999.1 hypothetical protein A6P36_00190 [Candidatus Arthromitus sp. SFB-turkey]
MNKLNKLYVTISSLLLISLTSCTNSNNKNSTSPEDTEQNIYTSTRTISENDTVNIINEDFSSKTYDHTSGVSTYPPIGEIKENEEISSDTNQNETLFTLKDVQQITNDLANEYNSHLEATSSEYENYISALTEDYVALENDYIGLLNDISSIIDLSEPEIENNNTNTSEQPENSENISQNTTNKEDSSQNTNNENNFEEKPENIPQTREEEVDLIYNKALDTASKNLDEFEPIQGQAPNVTNEQINNSTETPQNNESEKIDAETIFQIIKENVSLPSYSNKDINFLTTNYNLTSDKVNDFKLVSSDSSQNFFEMLIIKTSNISEEDLINKIQLRVDNILNNISEIDNTNINDKLLLINIDDYILFCFSDISMDILNFLESI